MLFYLLQKKNVFDYLSKITVSLLLVLNVKEIGIPPFNFPRKCM